MLTWMGILRLFWAVRPTTWNASALNCIVSVVALLMPLPSVAQTLVNDLNGTLSFGGTVTNGITGIVGQIAFAPGDSAHAYVATFGGGVTKFDYNPNATNFLSNPVTAVPASITSQNGVNGSLGLAFHEDPVLGTVMYLSPTVPFTPPNFTQLDQNIVRLNDANNDGIFGNDTDLNQAIVSNISVTPTHQVNQLQVRGDTLYANVGIRTQNGGQTAQQHQAIGGTGVDQTDPGETAYTGSLNFIEDLTLISNDTTTTNVSGFTFSDLTGDALVNDDDVRADTQAFSSTDPSKLRVFSTGFRNNYGLGIDDSGEIWVSFNQNENPNAEDELHRNVTFQSDHQFFKGNNMVGDWKVPGDEAAALQQNSSQIALDAGYFDPTNSVPVFKKIGFNVAAGGLDFFAPDVADASLRGDVLLARNSGGGRDVLYVDRETGNAFVVLEGLPGALEVVRDPFGNFLAGGSGRISLIEVLTGELFGDLDGNDVIDAADWVIFRTHHDTDLSGLPSKEAFLKGDLDRDGDSDIEDFGLFRTAFEDANGSGSFARLIGAVPEPGTATLIAGLLVFILALRPRRAF